jgi:hypothetical protein
MNRITVIIAGSNAQKDPRSIGVDKRKMIIPRYPG